MLVKRRCRIVELILNFFVEYSKIKIINTHLKNHLKISMSSNKNITIEEKLAKLQLKEAGYQGCLLTDCQFFAIMVELARTQFGGWRLKESKNDPEAKGKYFFYEVKTAKASWLTPDEWIDEIKKRIPERAEELEELLSGVRFCLKKYFFIIFKGY